MIKISIGDFIQYDYIISVKIQSEDLFRVLKKREKELRF